MLTRKHAKEIIEMDRRMRDVADEDLFFDWIALGVPDGDILEDTTIGEVQEMYDEDDYEDFKRIFNELIIQDM